MKDYGMYVAGVMVALIVAGNAAGLDFLSCLPYGRLSELGSSASLPWASTEERHARRETRIFSILTVAMKGVAGWTLPGPLQARVIPVTWLPAALELVAAMATTKLLKPQKCANMSKTSSQSEAAAVRELELDELEIVSGGDSKVPEAPRETITFDYGALQVQYVR